MTRLAPALVLAALVGCAKAPPSQAVEDVRPLGPSADATSARPDGTAYLTGRQSPDGAWRSDVYATFKDGTALTPLVLCALQTDADAGPAAFLSPGTSHVDPALSCSIQLARPLADTTAARGRASVWLAKFATSDGGIDEGPDGLPYPVYTAALSVIALSHPDNAAHTPARNAWLEYLLARQLTEANGWAPADKQYGGWGYYPRVPKKPATGEVVAAQHLLESNLSATAFALEALRAAGHADAAAYRKALEFVGRRQNPDGGFHFIYDDPVRNKAGGAPGDGPPRFHSYGSATADGVRALLAGRQDTNGEVVAARDWLTAHFAADQHPGEYVPAHEPNRNAVYFYYAASAAKALRLLGVEPDGLPKALLAKQKPDGSWSNPVELVRENDPVLATAYAVTALAECRKAK